MDVFGFIGSLFGYVLWFFFEIFKNYGVAIILFTIVLKIIMFPTSIIQQKSMAKNAKLSAKQKELQKKYANDKQKLNEEVNKLYQKEGVNPLGGCLPSIVPMILLFGVYYSVIMPLSNTMHLDATSVDNAVAYLNTIPGLGSSFGGNNIYGQIDIINIAQTSEGVAYLSQFFTDADIAKIQEFGQGFNFLGLNLLGKPADGFSNLWLVPALCLITSVGSQLYTMKFQGTMQNQQGCMKYMLLGMPLISAFIAYQVPAAVGLYWIASTVIGFGQSVLLQKFFNANIMGAKEEAARVALLEIEEKNVEYSYNPKFESNTNNNNKSNKKKKK